MRVRFSSSGTDQRCESLNERKHDVNIAKPANAALSLPWTSQCFRE